MWSKYKLRCTASKCGVGDKNNMISTKQPSPVRWLFVIDIKVEKTTFFLKTCIFLSDETLPTNIVTATRIEVLKHFIGILHDKIITFHIYTLESLGKYQNNSSTTNLKLV